MDLDSVSAVVRPRSHWEAIDLGFRMVRAHYAVMFASSLVITLPLFLLLHLLFWGHGSWAMFLLWWIKPLWERCHLYVLSRALFGPSPGLRETVRELPRYAFLQWLPWLTVRRLNPMRSLDLPVTQLEGLSGEERKRRLEILHRGNHSSAALWLTTLAVHVEGFLVLASFGLLALLVPPASGIDASSWLGGGDPWQELARGALVYGAALLVAPFYVGGGFALYFNRRTILEGWDIEIAFRRLAARIEAREGLWPVRTPVRRSVALLAAMAGGAILGLAGPVGEARATTSAELTPERARQSIDEVLADEAFHRTRSTHIPRFLLELELTPEEREESPLPDWLAQVAAGLLRLLAASMEVLLIAAALAAVGYLVYRYRSEIARLAGRAAPAGSRRRSPPGTLFGLDVMPESLPQNVVEAVLGAWHKGSKRKAYGLLYRATLAGLMERYDVDFHSGHTERDCVAVAESAVSRECADYFADLTRHWQLLAYAHHTPSDEVLESLCATWPRFFESPDRGDERHGV